MTNLNKPQIDAKISNIVFSDASSAQDRVSDIIIRDNNVGFSLDVTNITLEEAEKVRNEIIKQISTIELVKKVSIVLTKSKSITTKIDKSEKPKIQLDNVDKVIVIAAGKGGVGKSTISSILAQKLAHDNKKVGIIDADIYGPSIPNIFGLEGRPSLEDNKMVPFEKYGVQIISIGFLTDPLSSISWRGPMTSKALYQLLSLTKWKDLDYLIIDTPPGTGDIHLSLLQNYIVDKVIMVTTPQKISSLDVDKAINLYNKFNISILGIIENMSYFIDPKDGNEINLFSGNSGEELSIKHNIPILAKLPINPALSKACDLGESLESFTSLLKFKID